MIKDIITIISVAVCFLCTNLIWADGYYIYAILDKDKNEDTLLKIPKLSISKYPGWEYQREGGESINVWYPSMIDRQSYNLWVSTPKEVAAAKIKPNKNDQKLEIKFGGRIVSSNTTKIPSACDVLDTTIYKYQEDGIKGDYYRYIEASPGSARLNIFYLPNTSTKGIFCIKCVEKANCRLYGVTDSSISYEVFYKEEEMPREALDIHQAVGKYLDSKTIKNK